MPDAKSLCLFVHYSKESSLPYYVRIYIEELRRFFDKVVILTTDGCALDETHDVMRFPNFGRDFGLWTRAINNLNLDLYSRVGLVNDTNVLFRPLDGLFAWGNECGADVWGPTDSEQWGYHIQSHFVVVEKNAMQALGDFFAGWQAHLKVLEGKSYEFLRHYIVEHGEIGLSSRFIEKGLSLKAKWNKAMFPHPRYTGVNRHWLLWDKLIMMGYPFIKKRIIEKRPPSQYDPPGHRGWANLVRAAKPAWDFNKLFAEDEKFEAVPV